MLLSQEAAAAGSASQRTRERDGLRLAYTEALWSGAGRETGERWTR